MLVKWGVSICCSESVIVFGTQDHGAVRNMGKFTVSVLKGDTSKTFRALRIILVSQQPRRNFNHLSAISNSEEYELEDTHWQGDHQADHTNLDKEELAVIRFFLYQLP